MKSLRISMGVAVVLIVALASCAWADDKQAGELRACQEQLLTTKVKAQNLDEQRDRVTQEKSGVQVQLYRMQQELAAVKKELEDAKKK